MQGPALDISEIISEAVERCGIDAASLSAPHLTSVRRSLSLTLADIEGSDIAESDYIDKVTMQVAIGQRVVVLPDDTLDVLDALSIVGGSRLPMSRTTRQDDLLVNRPDQTGHPSLFWTARTATVDTDVLGGAASSGWGNTGFGGGTWGGAATGGATTTTVQGPLMVLWPSPAKVTTLEFNRLRMIQTPKHLGSSADIRRNWTEALCAGLAYRLAVKFAPDRAGALKGEWLEARDRAKIESRERGVVVVSGRAFGSGRRRRA